MSPAVTGPGPFLCSRSSAESRECIRSATDFRFSRTSTTSSCTPSMLVYSCSTPSISTSVIALPGIDDSSTRRSAFPSVWPTPRSNGSIPTRARRRLEHAAELLVAHLDPFGEPHLLRDVERALDTQLLARLLAHLDDVPGPHLEGGDAHRLLVHGDRLVAHQLASLGARGGEAH